MLTLSVQNKLSLDEREKYRLLKIHLIEARTNLLRFENDVWEAHPELRDELLPKRFSPAEGKQIKELSFLKSIFSDVFEKARSK